MSLTKPVAPLSHDFQVVRRGRSDRRARALLRAWDRYGGTVLLLVCAHAVLTASLRLGYAFHLALVIEGEPLDLLYRITEVRQWFSGLPVYGVLDQADYPPASYALLWPFVGWLSVPAARLVFGLTALASLVTIAWLSVRASGVAGRSTKAFAALFLLPFGAVQLAIWVGQLGLHVTASLMGAAALLLGTRLRPSGEGIGHRSWLVDGAAAVLLVASLVKPTMSAPVVAMLLVLAGRWRPGVLTAALYAGLTALALAFQPGHPVELIAAWLGQEGGLTLEMGSVNIHLWLHWLGVRSSLLPFSLVLLVGGIVLAWRHRAADPWLVLGVAALLGRFWIHHRAYDDMLLVIAAVPLFRLATLARARAPWTSLGAGLLLGALYASGHLPMDAYLHTAPPPLWLLGEVFRTVVWAGVLGFLLWHVHASSRRGAYAATG